MAEHIDPYACCGEGRLRPAYVGGDKAMPVLGCTACGEYIEPDPDHPDAAGDPEWWAAALAMCPPLADDQYADGDRPPDALVETPEENLARITATLGFMPLPAEPQ